MACLFAGAAAKSQARRPTARFRNSTRRSWPLTSRTEGRFLSALTSERWPSRSTRPSEAPTSHSPRSRAAAPTASRSASRSARKRPTMPRTSSTPKNLTLTVAASRTTPPSLTTSASGRSRRRVSRGPCPPMSRRARTSHLQTSARSWRRSWAATAGRKTTASSSSSRSKMQAPYRYTTISFRPPTGVAK